MDSSSSSDNGTTCLRLRGLVVVAVGAAAVLEDRPLEFRPRVVVVVVVDDDAFVFVFDDDDCKVVETFKVSVSEESCKVESCVGTRGSVMVVVSREMRLAS